MSGDWRIDWHLPRIYFGDHVEALAWRGRMVPSRMQWHTTYQQQNAYTPRTATRSAPESVAASFPR